jgi:ABC-type oligopeptide transport system substrate-binding subunit
MNANTIRNPPEFSANSIKNPPEFRNESSQHMSINYTPAKKSFKETTLTSTGLHEFKIPLEKNVIHCQE